MMMRRCIHTAIDVVNVNYFRLARLFSAAILQCMRVQTPNTFKHKPFYEENTTRTNGAAALFVK